MRVGIVRRSIRVYPDASVVCGEPRFDPQDTRCTTITNPRAVFEVLSESTEAYDRGEKFGHYRDLASLEEYVLVAQDRPLVEVFTRQEAGHWLFTAAQGLGAAAKLRGLGVDLPLAEVYTGIAFPADAAPAPQGAAGRGEGG